MCAVGRILLCSLAVVACLGLFPSGDHPHPGGQVGSGRHAHAPERDIAAAASAVAAVAAGSTLTLQRERRGY